MQGPRCKTLDRAVLVITGATHPAAVAIAQRAAARGANLILIDDDRESLRRVVDQHRCAGAIVLTPPSVTDVRDEVERGFGTLHAWINVLSERTRDVEATEDTAVSAFGPRGGTLITVDLLGVSNKSAARRRVRREELPINVCRVRADAHVRPAAVAHSTLACLSHPRRDIVVGPLARVVSALGGLRPRRSVPAGRGGRRPPGDTDREALRLVARGQVAPGKSTLYAVVRRHPWTTLAVAGAAALFFGSRAAHAPTVKRSRVNT